MLLWPMRCEDKLLGILGRAFLAAESRRGCARARVCLVVPRGGVLRGGVPLLALLSQDPATLARTQATVKAESGLSAGSQSLLQLLFDAPSPPSVSRDLSLGTWPARQQQFQPEFPEGGRELAPTAGMLGQRERLSSSSKWCLDEVFCLVSVASRA